MSPKGMLALVGALILIVLASSTLYVVPETHRAVQMRFGELVETDIQPGLHFKLPAVDRIRQFDVRVLTLDLPTHQYLTIEKKPLDVDSYVTWRIKDVAAYYRATGGDELRATSLLSSRIDNGLRNQFGVRTMHEVIAGERDKLMSELTVAVDVLTREEFGIEVLDVRVKGIELPAQVRDNVFRRMRTEREKEAQEHRSRGKELAEGVRADTDRQRTVALAEAYRESERLRGEGDEIAAAIYAEAFERNPEFYRFYRSLKAYEKTFSSTNDLMVIDAESEFLRYLKQSRVTP